MQITFLECAKRKDTYATLARESLKFKITQLSMAVIVQTPNFDNCSRSTTSWLQPYL